MKLMQFTLDGQIRLGMKTEKGIIDVEQAAKIFDIDVPLDMEDVIAGGEKALEPLRQLAQKEAVYAPCVTQPEKIICVGLNYIDHAKESNMDIPTSPVLFSKFNNALSAHNQVVTLP